ncbi:MAG: hypothetical protein NZ518_00060, partial [Dehalococcoidia bacterium]|nr:hypothetical protein [Dehalococcoidia bacterium]
APGPGILTVCRVRVVVAFDDPSATISIGTGAMPGAVMPSSFVDLRQALEYENTPDLQLSAGEQVIVTITPGFSTQGSGQVFLEFVPQ